MTRTRAQVNILIGGLSDDEAQWAYDALRAHKGLRVRGVVAHTTPGPERGDWLLDGFIDMFVREGLLVGKFADSELPKREAYRVYRKKLPAVVRWLEDLEKSQGLSPNHRVVLAHVCAGAMAAYFREINLFRVSALLSQIDRLPEAIDRSFPGYMAAGLLGMIVRTKRREKS